MIWESVKGEEEIEEVKKLSFAVLMLQGIATSIDALSVGFTIADYGFVMALVCSIIIAVVTFAICETGLYLGKTLGTKLTGKADVLCIVLLLIPNFFAVCRTVALFSIILYAISTARSSI